ncbi:hypothetical protein C3L33_00050, partial [Rhododendron williamsianum]
MGKKQVVVVVVHWGIRSVSASASCRPSSGGDLWWEERWILPIKMDLNDLNKVWEIKTLKKFRETEAREILQNIAKQECEELMAKGITGTGQGFDLPGRRLGGFTHQPPFPIQAAAMAAERRLHDDVWCGSNSSKSEGSSAMFRDSALGEGGSDQTSHFGSESSPETTDVRLIRWLWYVKPVELKSIGVLERSPRSGLANSVH